MRRAGLALAPVLFAGIAVALLAACQPESPAPPDPNQVRLAREAAQRPPRRRNTPDNLLTRRAKRRERCATFATSKRASFRNASPRGSIPIGHGSSKPRNARAQTGGCWRHGLSGIALGSPSRV